MLACLTILVINPICYFIDQSTFVWIYQEDIMDFFHYLKCLDRLGQVPEVGLSRLIRVTSVEYLLYIGSQV